jgi:hypothetical protein
MQLCCCNLFCCAAACDACSLQQLVNSIYPAQQAAAAAALETGVQQQQRETRAPVTRGGQPQPQQQQQPQLLLREELLHLSELHSSNSSYSTSLMHPHHSSRSNRSSSTAAAAAAAVQVQRQAEVSAALLLYFVCIPRQPIMQELVKQLKAAARCCLGPSGSSSSDQSRGLDQPEPLLLLQHPTYQLAVQAAAAYLNCNWVQFMRCYEQQPPMLMRVVMECALQRMRLHTVHSVVAAYRMMPSSVLLRWLGLQQDRIEQQQQQQQAAQTTAAASSQLGDLTRKQLVGVLLQAGDKGCKGARLAAEQCMMSDVALPDALQFRGSS